MKTLPAKWSLHASFPAPNFVAGALPHHGIHFLVNSAAPAVLAAVIADLAVSVASSLVDQPLRAIPGSPRRSPAGFAGSRGSVAPEGVAILNARTGLDLGQAIQAAALGRGVTRPLDVAVTQLIGGSLVSTPDAPRRLHELADFLSSEIGLIVLIDNFAGTRERDAEMVRAILSIAAAFPAPLLVVSDRLPDHVEPDSVLLRLSESELAVDNPSAPNVGPFKCAISKEQIVLDTDEPIIVNLGPRRAYTPAIAAKVVELPEKPAIGRPKADKAGETVYIVMTGRQLEPEEAAMFGDSKHTPDYRHAIKLAGQSTHKLAEIAVVASNRDPRREAASAVAQRVKAELLNCGLDQKVRVRVDDDKQIAA